MVDRLLRGQPAEAGNAGGQPFSQAGSGAGSGAGPAAGSGTGSAAAGGVGRVSLRTLITIRWVAVFGQLATVMLVRFGLGYDFPFYPSLAVIAVSALLNLAATMQGRAGLRLGERDAFLYLVYDVLQLSVLLYLTGGLQNPFALLLLAPLTVSAIILSRLGVMAMIAVTLASVTALAVWQYPVPRPGPDPSPLFDPGMVYRLGVWAALSVAAIFITVYVWQVAEEARRIRDAFAASQMALAREQKVSALGGLAAAAAHELGSPLGTISVVARELANDLPDDSPYAEDVALLLSESERCRGILRELAAKPETGGGEPFEVLSLGALIEEASGPYVRPQIALSVDTEPRDASKPPSTRRSPELMHGLGNILQNAFQFARTQVRVRAAWSREDVAMTIVDDGPGFPPHLLGRLGEPYLSGRTHDGGEDGHMGLGIFIATTLLSRTGAELQFGNAGRFGAQVVIRWKRHIFEAIRR
jgi:two-component system sensor histidine kinase RegB